MARSAVVRVADLDFGTVLAPERYDPRRQVVSEGIPLTDVCMIVRESVSSSGRAGQADRLYYVLETSAAREGFLVIDRPPVPRADIGSLKKRAQARDVLISRLRPYLRQVAYVDDEAVNWEEAELACSTEFYVLRPLDGRSIAFLIPFLLSPGVQALLAASQEGGHHPRVNEATLRSLRIPRDVIATRAEASTNLEQAAGDMRRATQVVARLVAKASESWVNPT